MRHDWVVSLILIGTVIGLLGIALFIAVGR